MKPKKLTSKRIHNKVSGAFHTIAHHEVARQLEAMHLQSKALSYCHVQHSQCNRNASLPFQNHVDAAVVGIIVVLLIAFEAGDFTQLPACTSANHQICLFKGRIRQCTCMSWMTHGCQRTACYIILHCMCYPHMKLSACRMPSIPAHLYC